MSARPGDGAMEVSAELLERRLDLRKRARADGTAGAPAEHADEWSAVERDVLDAVRGALTRIEAQRAAEGARAEQGLRRLAHAAPDFEGPIAAARLSLRQVEGRAAPEFSALRMRAARAAAELEAFRRQHGLRRQAVYPDSGVLQAGLLVLAAAGEAVFSATLFAETDPRGLAGGAVTALGLSGANVALGFLGGFLGLRYLAHAHPLAKAAGGIGFAIALALAAGLNLFAAAWRNRLGAENAGPIANLDAAALFGLTQPQAVILLMLGAGVWVFSALKGYSGFDDPYPDFGKMDRAARDGAEDLAERREEVRAALEAPVEQAREDIAERLEAAREAAARMRALYDEAAARVEDLDAAARAASQAAASAIQLYRRENIAARAGAAPRYFAEAPPQPAAPLDVLGRAADLVLAAEDRLAAAQTAAAGKLEALSLELEAASRRLEGEP